MLGTPVPDVLAAPWYWPPALFVAGKLFLELIVRAGMLMDGEHAAILAAVFARSLFAIWVNIRIFGLH
jgi:hypothetical protein